MHTCYAPIGNDLPIDTRTHTDTHEHLSSPPTIWILRLKKAEMRGSMIAQSSCLTEPSQRLLLITRLPDFLFLSCSLPPLSESLGHPPCLLPLLSLQYFTSSLLLPCSPLWLFPAVKKSALWTIPILSRILVSCFLRIPSFLCPLSFSPIFCVSLFPVVFVL